MKAQVSMVGRLTKDVTAVFANDDGSAKRALFTVACNSNFKDKDGKKKESVDFIPCVIWGEGLVKLLTDWGKKGRQVHIEGTLDTYQAGPDEDGKYPPTKTQVRVGQFEFLDRKPETATATETATAPTTPTAPAAPTTAGSINMEALAAMVAQKMLGAVNTPENASQNVPNGLDSVI